jgi:hypothetical protein
MMLVGGELSPTMAVQQVIGRGQGHFAPESLVQRRLDLAHDQDPARSRLFEKRCQELALFLQGHVLAFSPTGPRCVGRACDLALHEAPAQLACPARRYAQHPCRLGQAQAVVQRQDNGLRLAQLLHRLG